MDLILNELIDCLEMDPIITSYTFFGGFCLFYFLKFIVRSSAQKQCEGVKVKTTMTLRMNYNKIVNKKDMSNDDFVFDFI